MTNSLDTLLQLLPEKVPEVTTIAPADTGSSTESSEDEVEEESNDEDCPTVDVDGDREAIEGGEERVQLDIGSSSDDDSNEDSHIESDEESHHEFEESLENAPKRRMVTINEDEESTVASDEEDYSKIPDISELKCRSDIIDALKRSTIQSFSYTPWLTSQLFQLLPPHDAVALVKANEVPRELTIRANLLRGSVKRLTEKLEKRGIKLQETGRYAKVGLTIKEAAVQVGATPEYMSGEYMLQAPSSLLPVIALNVQPGDIALDMCAAPGGKSCFIAEKQRNTGTLYSNEASKPRCAALVANLARCGVRNSIVIHEKGQNLKNYDFPNLTKILVDAPCSGSGVIARDPSIKASLDEKRVNILAQQQRELLLTAIDLLKGVHKYEDCPIIVYSTCSILPQENEAVVDYVLRKRSDKVRLVETGTDSVIAGTPGLKSYGPLRFHPSVVLTRRFYPHEHNVDGFFVAAFKVVAPSTRRCTDYISTPISQIVKPKNKYQKALTRFNNRCAAKRITEREENNQEVQPGLIEIKKQQAKIRKELSEEIKDCKVIELEEGPRRRGLEGFDGRDIEEDEPVEKMHSKKKLTKEAKRAVQKQQERKEKEDEVSSKRFNKSSHSKDFNAKKHPKFNKDRNSSGSSKKRPHFSDDKKFKRTRD